MINNFHPHHTHTESCQVNNLLINSIKLFRNWCLVRCRFDFLESFITWLYILFIPIQVRISVEVPAGSDPKVHKYYGMHMFSKDVLDHAAADSEEVQFTERMGSDGKVYLDGVVTGLSPILVGWTESPLIIESPAEDEIITVFEGMDATMSVIASGGVGPLGYQWYMNSGSGYEMVSGATSASYVLSDATLNDNGHMYYCIVTDEKGKAVTSPVFTLQVLEVVVLPQTGDNAHLGLWLMAGVISLLMLFVVNRNRSRLDG